MPQNARALTIDVVAFPGFPDSQPVVPIEARIADGPAPLFGDVDRWDLAALGLSPSEKENLAVFHFTDFSGDWNYLARSFLMLLINPMDEKLQASGLYRPERVPKIKSLKHYFYALRKVKDWATTHGRTADLTTWTRSDLDDYYDWTRQHYAKHLLYSSEQLFSLIDQMGPSLPWYFTFALPTTTVRFSSGDIKTRPVEPQDFWSLIHACWTYIDVFAPDILQARKKITEQNERFDNLPHVSNLTELRRLLYEHFQHPDAYFPLHCSNRGPGTQGDINWEGISRLVGFRKKSGTTIINPHLKTRHQIAQDALKRGVPTRYGTIDHEPASVLRQDGTIGPWCPGFDSTYVNFEVTKLRAACFIFISAMSMMRLSEVSGLQAGSLTTYYGAPALKGAVHKHQAATGKPSYWWVSEPVAKAIEIAEAICDGDGLIFRSPKYPDRKMDHRDEIHRFIDWVNQVGPGRGLRKISDPNISAHRLRRTMAIITASQPDGEIALGITLKHNATRALANSVTSGYGAPSIEWERELGLERDSAAAAELISDWSKHRNGHLDVRGPGAHRYHELLDTVETTTTSKALMGDDRMLRGLLRDEASGITLGTLNHCLGDPAKAECLAGVNDEAKKAGPIMAACSPTRCRNSVITDKHLPVWLAEEDELKKLLSDRRLAKIHRHQLEHQLKDIQRVTKPGRNESK